MNSVEPIRNKETIEDIKDYLKSKCQRDYVLFCVGIYVPLRISDILPLKVRDVRNRTHISLRERKTRHEQLFPINPQLRAVLDEFIEGKKDFEFLFASRQKNEDGFYTPISRQRAYWIIRKACNYFGLRNTGCHTMRKTFGYHYYKKTMDVVKLMQIYGHTDYKVTLRYIGITQDAINAALNDFEY